MQPDVEQELAHTLLVELLAYQFASPVRWIETQDEILATKAAERLVEVGPADTLATMAKRTLATKYEAYDVAKSLHRQVLCYGKDSRDIYYDFEAAPEPQEPETVPTSPTDSSPSPAAAAAASSTTHAPAAVSAADVPDEPVKAFDVVRAVVAQKLKTQVLQVPLAKSIKDMVGGKAYSNAVSSPTFH